MTAVTLSAKVRLIVSDNDANLLMAWIEREYRKTKNPPEGGLL